MVTHSFLTQRVSWRLSNCTPHLLDKSVTGSPKRLATTLVSRGGPLNQLRSESNAVLTWAKPIQPIRLMSGAHHQEPATTPYFCHGVFTDRSIFSLNLSRIQIPTGTSVTNCNHKHGLMLTCRHDVDMFTWGCIVLSLPRRPHAHLNWPISREK